MGYRFLEHVTDAVVEAEGASLEDAFLAAADATVELTLDRSSVNESESVSFEAEGTDLHCLLYNWLEEIIYVLITRGFAIRRVAIEAAAWPAPGNGNAAPLHIRASARGEPIDLARHGFRVEIKSPTFHDMDVVEGSDGRVLARFLLDL